MKIKIVMNDRTFYIEKYDDIYILESEMTQIVQTRDLDSLLRVLMTLIKAEVNKDG